MELVAWISEYTYNLQAMKYTKIHTAIILCSLPLSIAAASTQELVYQDQFIKLDGDTYKMRVPAGYLLEFLTGDLDRLRLLNFDERGNLVIGSKLDIIYRLPPPYIQPEARSVLSGIR